MANSIKADVVVTYPSEDGEWSVLKLTKFEAQFLRQSLEAILGPSDGASYHINGKPLGVPVENPEAYAQ